MTLNANSALAHMNPEPLAYSVADACRVTAIGRTTLYALINEGKLQACKVGKRTLIPASSLRALIEGQAA